MHSVLTLLTRRTSSLLKNNKKIKKKQKKTKHSRPHIHKGPFFEQVEEEQTDTRLTTYFPGEPG